ncbi:DeoR/GlpR family DNA-binding transcription regulator [Georgenia halophila]|uniref:Lactose phosphotransferase system repressor n=1 Tax=Georgenia halophila TaxID=620889 RepID=A0ABP8LGK6_9MICO
MRASETRREAILDMATELGLASVDDLARRFGVTASTIRRDLAVLSASGRLARTYGGAISTSHLPETSLLQRRNEALDAKRAIAAHCAKLVGDADSAFLDAGSTIAMVARELATSAVEADVTTSSLPVLTHLQSSECLRVQCIGGRLRPLSGGFVGPLAEMSVSRMTFDIAFVSADGVSARYGLCEADLEQTRFKELVAARSRAVYVLAHAAKLNHEPFDAWTHLGAQWTLVTDTDADPGVIDQFRAAGVDVVLAADNGTR